MEADVSDRERYRWLPQDCPICQVPPTRRLGRRGGSAHRAHLGVECEIWCCWRCGLIFPNPMPVPVAGLNQHYEVDPEDYFKEHRTDDKESTAASLLAQAEEITGGRGRFARRWQRPRRVASSGREFVMECHRH